MDDLSQAPSLDRFPGFLYRCRYPGPRRIFFASPGCQVLTGYTAGELADATRLTYDDLIHTEDRPVVEREIELTLNRGRDYECFYRLADKGGGERWVWERGRALYDAKGQVTALEGWVMAASDQLLAWRQAGQQLADEKRKVAALHSILEAVSTPAELPVILKKSLRAALAAARGDGGFIHLRDKSGIRLRLVAMEGVAEKVAQKITSVSAEDGLVAWVARHKEALHIPSIKLDARTVYLAESEEMQVYVGVPIARGRRVWGTLSVLGQDPAQFGAEEVAMLVSVGEEIGIVVENIRLQRHAERLLLVQERNRLARELHDSVSQSLYSVTLFAEAGRRLALEAHHEATADYFNQIGQTGKQALKEMRLLIHKLRPSVLAKEGLVRALQQRLNSVEGRAGVKSQLLVEGEMKASPALEDALYLIAQEALNNALKHALASEVIVRVNWLGQDAVLLEIEDNGRGFDPQSAAGSDGMGLVTMQERAESFDGQLTLDSAPGRGCRVSARLYAGKAGRWGLDDTDMEDLL